MRKLRIHTNSLGVLRFFFVLYALFLKTHICFTQGLPIKPTRTISFTTDEGSYMDVNVSPDGKTLVFTLLGDLYAVSSFGGRAKQLTLGLSMNFRPVWSPDVKRIACISDYSGAFHLNVINVANKSRLVLGKSSFPLNPNMANPSWSLDGNYIYVGYDSQDPPNKAYGLSGGVAVLSQQINYFSIIGQSAYFQKSGYLYCVNLKNNITKKKDSLLVENANNMIVSPNQHWLAFTVESGDREKRSLVVQDLINHSTRVLVESLIVNSPRLPEGQRQSAFSFSPDSKSLYIGYGGKIHSINVQTGEDHIIPFVAQVEANLAPLVYNTYRLTHDSLQVKYTRSANTSPDGKHLVFMALNKVYVMDLLNKKPRPLVSQPGVSQFQPVYSPDGKWIAYVSWCDTAGGHLWRVRASGGTPEQLTRVAGQYQRPSWSPDGRMIAVVRGEVEFRKEKYGENEYGQLQVINVNGHHITVIDDDMVPLWNQIGFSDDGARILYQPKDFDYTKKFSENDSLKPRLISRDLNGLNQVTVAVGSSATKEPHYYQQRSISPDGRFIVYTMREDLYLVPVCPLSEYPVIFDSKMIAPMIRFAAGVDPHWEKGGEVLAWTYGNQFCRIDPDKIVEAAQKKKSLGNFDTGPVKVVVVPDEKISIELKVQPLFGKGTIALKNVRILTMLGDKIVENGVIIIKNGRIKQLGTVNQIQVPEGATSLNLAGKTVMPGMIDMHMHVNCRENVYPMQKSDYLANLAYGVTTGRDPASSFDSFGAGELIASGQTIGPRLFTVGRAIFQYSDFKLDDFDDALAIAQKRKLLGGTYIKQYNLPNRLQKQWLLMACKQTGLNMTNEGNEFIGDNMVLANIAMIKDGSTGVEHNPDWGDVYKDVTMFIAKSGSYLGETLGAGYGPQGDYYFNYTYWRQPSNQKLKRFAASRLVDDGKTFKWLTTLALPTNKDARDSLVRWYPSMIDAKITALGGKVTLGAHGSSPIGATSHSVLWALQMGG